MPLEIRNASSVSLRGATRAQVFVPTCTCIQQLRGHRVWFSKALEKTPRAGDEHDYGDPSRGQNVFHLQ